MQSHHHANPYRFTPQGKATYQVFEIIEHEGKSSELPVGYGWPVGSTNDHERSVAEFFFVTADAQYRAIKLNQGDAMHQAIVPRYPRTPSLTDDEIDFDEDYIREEFH